MKIEKLIQGRLGLFDFRLCDIFGLGQMVGAGVGAAGNIAATKMTNATNERIASLTNAANERINSATNRANIDMNAASNQAQIDIANAANALNERMFHEQNEWNENMWEKEMEYNSPENQMKRLIEAGINPNLVSGGSAVGSSGTGNASPAPNSESWSGAQVADIDSVRLEPYYNQPWTAVSPNLDLLGELGKAASVANLNAETDKVSAESFKAWFDNSKLEERWYNEEELHEWKINNDMALNDVYKANRHYLNSKAMRENAGILVDQAYQYNLEANTRFIDKKIGRFDELTDKQIAKLGSDIDEAEKRIDELDSQIHLNQSSASVNRSVVGVNNAQVDYINASTDNIKSSTVLNQDQHKYNEATFKGRVQKALAEGNITEQEYRNSLAQYEQIKLNLVSSYMDLDVDEDDAEKILDFCLTSGRKSSVALSDVIKCMRYVKHHPHKERAANLSRDAWQFVTKSFLVGQSGAAYTIGKNR